jgi:hypothetical protein
MGGGPISKGSHLTSRNDDSRRNTIDANRVTTDPPRTVRSAHIAAGGLSALAGSLLLSGCERVPSVNVLGAFFPSWMLCIVVGIVLTLAGRYVLVATGLDPWIGPRGLVYPALALAFTLATWLIFFRG